MFDQAPFLARALDSALRQTVAALELVVVDDGSRDATHAVVAPFVQDERVRYVRLGANGGVGAACNRGLDETSAPVVAYLPADDVWDDDHVEALLACIDAGAVLAVSGVRHHDGQRSLGEVPGHGVQMVQVAHRRVDARWRERDEIETDDLHHLAWDAVAHHGEVAQTRRVTCTWSEHPEQRHKRIRESFDGGLNVFRDRYQVATPLRFRSRDGVATDEVELYRTFRARDLVRSHDGLRILLVGELSYHPERVVALAERGHELFGLWTPDALGPQTVGPVPFGHVRDVPREGWQQHVRELRPDVVYAQLSWRAVPFAHAVLGAGLGIPFVWHVKESPQRSILRGTWPQLVDLHTRSDAQIYSTPEERDWFAAALPGRLRSAPAPVIDGDLPKREWFTDEHRTRLSEHDGELHVAALGRPIGLDADAVRTLAAHRVHVHLHGLVNAPGPSGAWTAWLDEAQRLAPGRVHVHDSVPANRWVSELSRYDAGWMHRFDSDNGGDVRRATWDDLNHPARIGPLVAAGLPLLQHRTPGNLVAAAELVDQTGVGLVYDDLEDLAVRLHDGDELDAAQRATREQRDAFTFDAHVDRLVDVLRSVIP